MTGIGDAKCGWRTSITPGLEAAGGGLFLSSISDAHILIIPPPGSRMTRFTVQSYARLIIYLGKKRLAREVVSYVEASCNCKISIDLEAGQPPIPVPKQPMPEVGQPIPEVGQPIPPEKGGSHAY
jgi:hypothetical protein